MKKALMITLVLLISVAFVASVFAQAKPTTEKPAAAPEKPAKAEKPAKKGGWKTLKGEFVSADAAAKTVMVKGEKGDMTFDVSGTKKMAEFKAGDKVRVRYVEKDGKMFAKAVKAEKAAKAKKEAAKKENKPATDKPAAEPVKK